MKYYISLICLLSFLQPHCLPQSKKLTTGAERTSLYFSLLKGKKVAVVANQTSIIGEVHLVDSLVATGIDVTKVFSPEHGFRGKASAGEKVENDADIKTGIPIISLYGEHKKPTTNDLEKIDVVVFDIQDVGARFYTYISTLTLVMEACAEQEIPFIVLDRPNPHGNYVDGPVLEKEYASFVGMHPVPIVHGMTIAEYATMVNEMGWLNDGIRANLTTILMDGYDHSLRYELPVPPSPNLPNANAVCLYPSLCLFEGTDVSVGRGTDFPFQVLGHPKFFLGSFLFTPASRPEAVFPKHEGKNCFGQNLTGFAENVCIKERKIHLQWIINYYKHLKDYTTFFNDYFDNLAGNSTLRNQIIDGLNEEEIRKSWQEDITHFKEIRKKYLLYNDF